MTDTQADTSALPRIEHCETAVIGAGLSGLLVAEGLAAGGAEVLVFETRSRPGGRILGIGGEIAGNGAAGATLDAGPTWIWPHNHRMLGLIERLGLSTFEQYAEGRLVFQDRDSAIQRDLTLSPMAGSLRVAGGLAQVTGALAARIGAPALRLGHSVTGITVTGARTVIRGTAAGAPFSVHARRTVLALPPRLLARDIAFEPGMDNGTRQTMQAIPTWMAGHAKLLATYDRPFWREAGLSGDAISHRGPLAEVHDASPPDGSFGALFGFVGVPADRRAGQEEALKSAALLQLGTMFGNEAARPTGLYIKDWAEDRATATEADQAAPAGHPSFQPQPGLEALADLGLYFAGSEMAPVEGGFLEGAAAAAEHVLAGIRATAP